MNKLIIRLANVSATAVYLERIIAGFGILMFVSGNVFYYFIPAFLFALIGWGGAILTFLVVVNHHVLTTFRARLNDRFYLFYIFVDLYMTAIIESF